MNKDRVEKIAKAVRRALDECPRSELPWANFPRGACGDVSLILGQVLDDAGIKGFQYICGNKYEPFSSHGWLQNGEWIVDITADQFQDVNDPVIVTDKSEWHACWARNTPTAGTLREYGVQVPQLWQVLSILKPKLDLRFEEALRNDLTQTGF